MPARIIGLYAAVVAFIRLKWHREEPNVDQLLLNALNKSHQDWVERGWVEGPR